MRWLNRRADTVYPDRAGLYPIREGRVGDFFHRSDAESCRDRLRGQGYGDAFVVESLINIP